MEEGNDKNEVREEIFSKAVRAGKRTYFFDVKVTRRNEYYLTITESKRRFSREGQPFYEKHKIFLYREDLEKFAEGLTETSTFIEENQPVIENEQEKETTVKDEAPQTSSTNDDEVKKEEEVSATEDFTSVEFEDLEEKSE
jgi:hypothetical protein